VEEARRRGTSMAAVIQDAIDGLPASADLERRRAALEAIVAAAPMSRRRHRCERPAAPGSARGPLRYLVPATFGSGRGSRFGRRRRSVFERRRPPGSPSAPSPS